MLEIFLLNILMFGTLYGVAKAVERATWYVICNSNELYEYWVNKALTDQIKNANI
jgi:hypothetical protein